MAWEVWGLLRWGTAWPSAALRTVMMRREAKAAEKTTPLGCLIAINAAIKNVLSPNSEMIIMAKEKKKAWTGEETRPDGDVVSDPSKSNIECNGDSNPSESESSYTTRKQIGLKMWLVRRPPPLLLPDMRE